MNPFDGVTPNFSVFGVEFTAWWQMLLSGLWGLAFVVTAFLGVIALLNYAKAKRDNRDGDVAEAKRSLISLGIAIAGLAALPLIFTAIVRLTPA